MCLQNSIWNSFIYGFSCQYTIPRMVVPWNEFRWSSINYSFNGNAKEQCLQRVSASIPFHVWYAFFFCPWCGWKYWRVIKHGHVQRWFIDICFGCLLACNSLERVSSTFHQLWTHAAKLVFSLWSFSGLVY